MKIYRVFNHYTGNCRVHKIVAAETREQAIERAVSESKSIKGWTDPPGTINVAHKDAGPRCAGKKYEVYYTEEVLDLNEDMFVEEGEGFDG